MKEPTLPAFLQIGRHQVLHLGGAEQVEVEDAVDRDRHGVRLY